MHFNTIRFARRYRYLYDAFQGRLTKGFSFSQESQFLMNRINFAARDKIDSSLSNRLTSIFNLKEKNVDYFSSCFSRIIFLLALRCASDIGASPSLSVSSSWNDLVDTDSESAIFSSGLLALFYLRFCGACTPFSSLRVSICRQRSFVRSLSFPFLSLHAPIFFSLSPLLLSFAFPARS